MEPLAAICGRHRRHPWLNAGRLLYTPRSRAGCPRGHWFGEDRCHAFVLCHREALTQLRDEGPRWQRFASSQQGLRCERFMMIHAILGYVRSLDHRTATRLVELLNEAETLKHGRSHWTYCFFVCLFLFGHCFFEAATCSQILHVFQHVSTQAQRRSATLWRKLGRREALQPSRCRGSTCLIRWAQSAGSISQIWSWHAWTKSQASNNWTGSSFWDSQCHNV